MLLKLLRWLLGWTEFEVRDAFPERFLNTAYKSGIHMWDFKSGEALFGGCVRIRDTPYLERTAEKTACELHILRQHGLPYLLKKYRSRYGLLIGAVVWGAALWYGTGFIWNVQVTVTPDINEYELRQELKEHGLYEGARFDSIDADKIENALCLEDSRISWITINLMGTEAEVRVNSRIAAPEKNAAAGNILSRADGTVTRMEVKNGTAKVKVGDGVRSGQMLVSGVIEYTDGSSKLVEGDAQIYAKTFREVSIKVPVKQTLFTKQVPSLCKRTVNLMGAELPLTLNGTPKGDYSVQGQRQQLELLGRTVPIYIFSEIWQPYTITSKVMDDTALKQLLQHKLELYEFFMLQSADRAKILSKKWDYKREGDDAILTVSYEIEENIAQKSPILTR